MSKKKSYAIIILAAGFSSRLGRAKQLLPYGEHSLLEHIISIALQTKASQVIVVINDALKDIPPRENMTIVINEDAEKGLSSSIQKGIKTINDIFPDTTAAIIMPCDQPFVNSGILDGLIQHHEQTGKGIVAAKYAETFGTPALFHRSYFVQLQSLTGDKGAKPWMKQYAKDMAFVDFPQGNIDIDTPDDLKNIGIKL